MSKKRKQYSREFKIQLLREIENGTPISQLSRQHEIHESLIHKWKRQYNADPQNAFSGSGIIKHKKLSALALFRLIRYRYGLVVENLAA